MRTAARKPDAHRMRRARRSDIPALEALELELYTEDIVYAPEWEYHLDHPENEVWLIEDGKGLLGDLLITARSGSTNLRIEGIAVATRAQGQGHGRRLLRKAVTRAKARGKQRLTLEVRRDNIHAIEVYHTFGFVKTGTIPGYYEDGADALRMRYDIAG